MNRIGIDLKKSEELAKQLNDLLANYQIYYMNVRGFHWNIKGHNFFELHLKFEELYDDLVIKIDEIAERVLTLGQVPLHTFSDYMAIAKIKSAKDVTDGTQAAMSILEGFEVLLKKQRAIMALAGDADDEGTSALMSDYIREQEKLVWMYSSFLGE